MSRRTPPEIEAEVVRLSREGFPPCEIQHRTHLPYGTITTIRARNKVQQKRRYVGKDKVPEEKVVVPFSDLPPPSHAMIRLAEFDPVIRRAMLLRLGSLPQEDDPDAVEG